MDHRKSQCNHNQDEMCNHCTRNEENPIAHEETQNLIRERIELKDDHTIPKEQLNQEKSGFKEQEQPKRLSEGYQKKNDQQKALVWEGKLSQHTLDTSLRSVLIKQLYNQLDKQVKTLVLNFNGCDHHEAIMKSVNIDKPFDSIRNGLTNYDAVEKRQEIRKIQRTKVIEVNGQERTKKFQQQEKITTMVELRCGQTAKGVHKLICSRCLHNYLNNFQGIYFRKQTCSRWLAHNNNLIQAQTRQRQQKARLESLQRQRRRLEKARLESLQRQRRRWEAMSPEERQRENDHQRQRQREQKQNKLRRYQRIRQNDKCSKRILIVLFLLIFFGFVGFGVYMTSH